MMKNFEVQHTLRLYDPEFVAEIGRLYEKKNKEYRNKNEFLTDVVKLGIAEMKRKDKSSQMTDGNDDKSKSSEQFSELYEILNEISKYMTTQFKTMYINNSILEKLTSSIYNIVRGMNKDDRVLTEKADDGFYDDLPERFEKIIIRLKTVYGV